MGRTALGLALSTLALSTMALIYTYGYPPVSDALRNRGSIDAYTPISAGFNIPNRNLYMESGNQMVGLADPHDIALGGRSTVTNLTPGLGVKVNLDVMREIITDQNSLANLPSVSLVETIIVPFSLIAPITPKAEGFLVSEAIRINNSRDLKKIGAVRFIKPISADDELYKLTLLGMIPNLSGSKPMVGLPLLASLGGGGPSLEEQLSVALSTKWLEKVIEVSNETSNRSTNLNPDFPSDELFRLIQTRKPITVTFLDKHMFDSRHMRRVFPKPTPIPTPFRNSNTQNTEPECVIKIQGTPFFRAPAKIEFAVGVVYSSGANSNVFIQAARWDLDADGRWDTPLKAEQYKTQSRIYTEPGQYGIAAMIALSDGRQTKPCFASITLD